jgi:MFS family permease
VAIFVVVAEVYDERLRPRMFGLLSAAWVLPSLLGPLVAGALTQHASWRLVFLTVPPLVGGAAFLILPALRRPRTPRPAPTGGRRRWPFALLAGAGIVALQHAADRLDVFSAAFAALGVATLVPAVRVLLPRGTVRARRGLPTVVALRGLAAGAFFAVDALVPLTLTVVHGLGPTAAALPLTLGALGWSSASWWQGRHPRARRHRLIAVGMVGIATAAAAMAVVSQPWAPVGLAYGAWVVGGAGMGLVMPSVSLLTLDLSPVAERGRNSAALQIGDVLTSAVCIGFGGALVAAADRGTFGLTGAVAAVDLTMVAVALLGVALAGRVRPTRPRGAARPAATTGEGAGPG